ncbi:MAG: hypothetical protein FJW66_07345, partial [Actinobacteria bacterium]|nr:hypothetical protein [Actinomycetota bacterium]
MAFNGRKILNTMIIAAILVIFVVSFSSCQKAKTVEETTAQVTAEATTEATAGETAPATEAVELPENAVVSVKVDAAPAIDGKIDDIWAQATATEISTSGGTNTESTTVILKSVYTDDQVFFLAQWDDPGDSKQRAPWQKQDDGTWKKLTTSDKSDENTYYEDKLAMIWNINDSISGFNEAGCMITCHAGEAEKAYGNKYTQNEGELGDIWHWKRVRTGTVGQVDDQYLDSTRYSEDTKEAGRHSDPKDSGGYADNQTEDKSGPAFTGPNQPANDSGEYWILDNEKQDFADTY